MRPAAHLLFIATAGLLLALPGCSIFVDLDPLSGGGDAGGGGGGSGGGGPGTGGDGGAPGSFTFTDDALEAEFGAGAFENTRWTADHVEMNGAVSPAYFSSRVLDAGAPATWQTIGWQPQAPYGKPLPDMAGVEQGYPEGGVNMTGNVLLLHLDGQGAISPGSMFPDTSGRAHAAVASMPPSGARPLAAGRFGQAFEDDASSYLAVSVAPDGDFQFAADDLTWALWVKTASDCAGNDVYLGVEDPGAGVTHLWLGCTEATDWSDGCADKDAGGTRAAGYFISDQGSATDGGGFCGSTIIDDGRWHHLAVTKQGHQSSTLRLYVDGELEFTNMVTFIKPFQLLTAPELAIGAFSTGTYQATGTFDEVAIWRRALSDEEIRALYRRGALRLGFQVRACVDAQCATPVAYTGPDGTADGWLEDLPAALAPGSPWELSLPERAQWFQYRARFESDAPGVSPWLRAVTVAGRR